MPPGPPEPPDPSLGVFETLRVRGGRVQALEAHLERLAGSVSELYELGLPAELPSRIQAHSAILEGEHRLRVDVVPDAGTLRVKYEASPLHPPGTQQWMCRPVLAPGGLGRHKWCDRRPLARMGDGDPVALLVDRNGDVLEAAWANFWLLEEDSLLTPPTDGRLLPGVTRALVLELAPSLGLAAREEPISLARARAGTEMFLTSALRLAVSARLEPRPPRREDARVAAIREALSASAWD
jgi:para-aminobenzoate synthetase / 4-amino-4-deoxychorismate lyase